MARVFHALSDETRLRIIGLLRHGERCVCDLVAALGLGQSRLSFHLKTLKDAGLVLDRPDGRWVYYRLDEEALASLGTVVDALPENADSASRACC
jgi:ArsR family transcriptional regulator